MIIIIENSKYFSVFLNWELLITSLRRNSLYKQTSLQDGNMLPKGALMVEVCTGTMAL